MQRRRLTVVQLPPPSLNFFPQYPLGCVPVCLHACMSTHTRFPIIPSPHPPHLLPLSSTHSFRLSLSVSPLLSLLFFFLLSYLPHPPIFTSPFHLFLSSSLFSFLSFLASPSSFFLLLFFWHFVSPFIRYFFQPFLLLVTVELAPSNSGLPTNFFPSLLFPTLSLFPPTPVLSPSFFPLLSLSFSSPPSIQRGVLFYSFSLSFVCAPIDRFESLT